jgi:hypothetical protein
MEYRRLIECAFVLTLPFLALTTCVEPPESAKNASTAVPALSALAVSEGTLDPAFSRDVTSYSITVRNAVSTLTVTPSTRDKTANIEIDGIPSKSGTPSIPIALAVGKNEIRVVTRAADRTAPEGKAYEIAVIRAGEIPSLTLDFAYGEDGASGYRNIYVAWIDDLSGNVIQNLVVCDRLVGIGGTLTNTALPYWKTKRCDAEQVKTDAVTGATKAKRDFTVAATLKDPAVTAFKVCFETDRSYDANDWFTDQPALLYSATVNLAEPKRRYPLALEAWTANEGTMSSLKEWLGTLSVGSAQTELRFITNAKDATAAAKPPFGDPAPDKSATCFVKGITLTVE